MPKVSKKVACYVRVSTVGQNEAGQRTEIRSWLKGNGIDPERVDWYIDKKSGDDLDRPAFEDLQKNVFAGSVSTVVVYKLDRLSRKLRDGINTLCDWCDPWPAGRVCHTTDRLQRNRGKNDRCRPAGCCSDGAGDQTGTAGCRYRGSQGPREVQRSKVRHHKGKAGTSSAAP